MNCSRCLRPAPLLIEGLCPDCDYEREATAREATTARSRAASEDYERRMAERS